MGCSDKDFFSEWVTSKLNELNSQAFKESTLRKVSLQFSWIKSLCDFKDDRVVGSAVHAFNIWQYRLNGDNLRDTYTGDRRLDRQVERVLRPPRLSTARGLNFDVVSDYQRNCRLRSSSGTLMTARGTLAMLLCQINDSRYDKLFKHSMTQVEIPTMLPMPWSLGTNGTPDQEPTEPTSTVNAAETSIVEMSKATKDATSRSSAEEAVLAHQAPVEWVNKQQLNTENDPATEPLRSSGTGTECHSKVPPNNGPLPMNAALQIWAPTPSELVPGATGWAEATWRVPGSFSPNASWPTVRQPQGAPSLESQAASRWPMVSHQQPLGKVSVAYQAASRSSSPTIWPTLSHQQPQETPSLASQAAILPSNASWPPVSHQQPQEAPSVASQAASRETNATSPTRRPLFDRHPLRDEASPTTASPASSTSPTASTTFSTTASSRTVASDQVKDESGGQVKAELEIDR